MKQSELHKKLYRQVPSFECIPGCTACCAFVFFSRWEWKRIPEHKRKTNTDADCPYICEEGCSIYSVRPLICRLFGNINDPRMICPHGRGPLVILTASEGQAIMREYMAATYGGVRTPYMDEQGNMIPVENVLIAAGMFREKMKAAKNVMGPS